MTTSLVSGLLACVLYLSSLGFLYQQLKTQGVRSCSSPRVVTLGLLAVVAHFISAWSLLRTDGGYDFGVVVVSTLIFASISLVVLISSLRRPLGNLMMGLFPLAMLAIIVSLSVDTDYRSQQITGGIVGHVLFSILAYSFFTIAALQAAFLAFQNYQLRHRHAASVIRRFPPLQDMEGLLFELLWVGQILLSLGIVFGFLFAGGWSQGLPHKTFFSILAWVVFSVLLWGRHRLGWRGNTAIRGTLTGFLFLLLGFYGSKFVLEYIL